MKSGEQKEQHKYITRFGSPGNYQYTYPEDYLEINGIRFCKNPHGGVDYGEITPEISKKIRRQAGKIRLRLGNDKAGEFHINREQRLKQLKTYGYKNARQLVWDVCNKYDAIYQGNTGRLILRKKGQHDRLIMISLEPAADGDFYDVKTAFIVRSDYFNNKKTLWDTAQSYRPRRDPGAHSGQSTIKSISPSSPKFKKKQRFVLPLSLLEKAYKDYSKLIPVKVKDKTGNMVTRWVASEEEKQKPLFTSKDQGKGGEEGYFSVLDEQTRKYQIEPLIDQARQYNRDLANRLQFKYQHYQFDQDTRELDIKLDYESLKYLMKLHKEPHQQQEIQSDYEKATTHLAQQINSRKRKMLKLKEGAEVTTRKGPGTVVSFSPRGFPIIEMKGKKEPFFIDELKAG